MLSFPTVWPNSIYRYGSLVILESQNSTETNHAVTSILRTPE